MKAVQNIPHQISEQLTLLNSHYLVLAYYECELQNYLVMLVVAGEIQFLEFLFDKIDKNWKLNIQRIPKTYCYAVPWNEPWRKENVK